MNLIARAKISVREREKTLFNRGETKRRLILKKKRHQENEGFLIKMGVRNPQAKLRGTRGSSIWVVAGSTHTDKGKRCGGEEIPRTLTAWEGQ